MMIAPEVFVKMYKDKTYEELIQIRYELIDEIEGFEERAASGEPEVIKIHPSPDVRYQMNLQYLGKLCELIVEKYREKEDDE